MLKIGIAGICGKMGMRIADLAISDGGIKIASGLEHAECQSVGKQVKGVVVTASAEEACQGVECLIDFTLPGPTLEHLEVCRKTGVSMVIGTTGIDTEGEKKISEAAGEIPIVFSPNMAVGVNLFFKIVREAARVLGGDFDIKIDETHHIHKKDSPSGTAKMIAKIVKEASGKEPPVEAFREGEVIGNHGIEFDGEYENLQIRHDAKSRDVFASGALRAAKFLRGKEPGLYTMADVLGL
ncbi:MAG: 4-hydroxy-tetrahydrodipicolinate reductase [Candidatus Omnitrophica bacterium]|nr:4-hydroxy-tetrahydrodipicolinate reductase [Candidatus Omnitrophota bacterium]